MIGSFYNVFTLDSANQRAGDKKKKHLSLHAINSLFFHYCNCVVTLVLACGQADRDTCWTATQTVVRFQKKKNQVTFMVKQHFIHNYYQHSGLWKYLLKKKIKEANKGR